MTTLGLEALKLNETKRANLANENIKESTLAETRRANLANEGIKLQTLDETIRANKANEALKQSSINVDWANVDVANRQLTESQRRTNLEHATGAIAQATSNQALGYSKAVSAATQAGETLVNGLLKVISFRKSI